MSEIFNQGWIHCRRGFQGFQWGNILLSLVFFNLLDSKNSPIKIIHVNLDVQINKRIKIFNNIGAFRMRQIWKGEWKVKWYIISIHLYSELECWKISLLMNNWLKSTKMSFYRWMLSLPCTEHVNNDGIMKKLEITYFVKIILLQTR